MRPEIKERIATINRGEVPEGYKRTKVGVIPQDWSLKRLAELGEFHRGKGIPKAKILDRGIGCVTYGELYTTYNYSFRRFRSYTNRDTATRSFPIEQNDILFAGSGEKVEEIGKCVAYLGEEEGYAGGDIVVFRPKNLNGEFFGYLLNHDIVNEQKYKLGQGHSVVHIYAKDLETLLVPLTDTSEQQRIAEILSTWDNAIRLKDKVIEEKEEQKKGLMQKLLTGGVRLPGFDGEWATASLSEIAEISTGNKNNQDKVEVGDYPFFVRSDVIERIDSYSYDGEAILTPGDGRVGEVYHYIDGKFDYHQRVYKISNFCAKVAGKYVYYYLKQFFKKQALKYTAKATVDSLRMPMLTDMVIRIPGIQEQKAIAQVLSTADREIELLEEELKLLQLQKKGLMQLLLTGIVRVEEMVV